MLILMSDPVMIKNVIDFILDLYISSLKQQYVTFIGTLGFEKQN